MGWRSTSSGNLSRPSQGEDKPLSRFDVSGKVAIVTGGNVGIGANIAQTLLKEGWPVLTCSRRDYDTPPAAEGLPDAAGRNVPMTCDARAPDQCEALAKPAAAAR